MLYAANSYRPGITRRSSSRPRHAPWARGLSLALAGSTTSERCCCQTTTMVFYLYEALSRAAVKCAGVQAGILCERVMDSVWLDPHRSTPTGENS